MLEIYLAYSLFFITAYIAIKDFYNVGYMCPQLFLSIDHYETIKWDYLFASVGLFVITCYNIINY